ncbi:hypothetical protein V7201_02205 [Bacillus sp. JJ1122]
MFKIEWFARINGQEYELKRLSEVFNSLEACVQLEDDDDNQYILKSIHFTDCKNSTEVLNKAKELIQRINGIGKLTIDFFNSLQIDSIVQIEEDGGKRVSKFFDTSIMIGRSYATARLTIIRDGEIIEEEDDDDDVISVQSNWLVLAEINENVNTVIRLLSKGIDSWVNLYRLLEVIEGDLGRKRKVSDKGWITDKKRTLFRRTANSVTILGDDARHGFDDSEPPPNPMDITEAKSLIIKVIKEWLNEKIIIEQTKINT